MAYRLIIIFLFSYFVGFSQDSAKVFGLLQQSAEALKKSDVKSSLQLAHQALSFSKSNTYNKGLANVFNQLGVIFESQSKYDSANYYLIKSVDIAQSPTLKNELAVAHNLLGLVLWHQSQYKEALPHHAISLSLFKETGNQKGLADTYAKTGNVFYDLSDFPKSLDNFLQALKTYGNVKDNAGIADVCNYIGKVYNRLNEKESAKKYLFKALSLHQKFQNNRGIAVSYNGLGNVFMDNHDLIKALKFFEKSKDFHAIGGDQIGISIAHINIGTIYDMMSVLSDDSLKIIALNINYKSNNAIRKSILDSAAYYFQGSIVINSKVGNQFGLIYGYNGIGDVYVKEHQYKLAIPQFQNAYSISRSLKATSEQYESAKRLANCYEMINNKDSAYFYLKTYTHLKEEVIGEERQRELFKKESQYEYDKQLQKQQLIKKAEAAIVAEKEKRQTIIIVSIAIVLLIVIYFAVVLNKRLKTTRSQKQLIEQQKFSLEQKNKEIIDSITYAKRIQDAMLTSVSYLQEEIKKLNAENFIVFKPKDIVSGDFYWFHVDGKTLYYVTADSTGHGVPGGFMSMLGINLLSEIVIERKIKDPGTILNLLRDEIIRSLKTDEGYSMDGMDAVFCKIDTEKQTLEYASANNSIYLIRQGELSEFKSQKMPVGYMEAAVPFHTSQIELQKNDVIYTFTDGFADQFGGPKGKKFKYSQLKQLLISISTQSLKEQQHTLNHTFEDWKGRLEQVDDVCVVGFKL
jgi:serine phosphatase RsbU (regulator of sigma subunit)/tetratricopeptide (TPR) repeat protein